MRRGIIAFVCAVAALGPTCRAWAATECVDGYVFPSGSACAKYERERVRIDAYDEVSGRWVTTSASRTTGGSLDLSGLATSAASRLLNRDVEVGAVVDGTKGTSSATTAFSEERVRRYRVVTGEGVLLTDAGAVLAEPRSLFSYLERMDAFASRCKQVGLSSQEVEVARHVATTRRNVGIATTIVGFGILIGVPVLDATDDDGTTPVVFLGGIFGGAGVAITGAGLWGGGIAAQKRIVPGHEECGSWTVLDALPFIRTYNEHLAEALGGS